MTGNGDPSDFECKVGLYASLTRKPIAQPSFVSCRCPPHSSSHHVNYLTLSNRTFVCEVIYKMLYPFL
jgi:hypothetical protein